MAEFVYKAGKEPLIIQHENTALALYSEILSEYAPLLEPFACSFKVALYLSLIHISEPTRPY